MVRVAVGSTNPVKVNAVRRIFTRFAAGAEILAVHVQSGVPEQPVGESETARGAEARARAALQAADADWGVGLEGGVEFAGDDCWQISISAVVRRDGRLGLGKGAKFLLPPAVAEGVRQGGEVGPLMDRLSGTADSKRKGGAIGYLTNGAVLREDLFAATVAAALVRFFHPELYER